MTVSFLEHEIQYMNQRLTEHILRFNGKWLTKENNQFIYTENPFTALQMIKSVK